MNKNNRNMNNELEIKIKIESMWTNASFSDILNQSLRPD